MSEHIYDTSEQAADREVKFPLNWTEAYLRRLGILATDEKESQNSDE